MTHYFFDTSALVKLYVQEAGTDRLLSLVENQSESQLAVLALSSVEARSAIRRRERAGDIDPQTAEAILQDLREHLDILFVRQPLNDALIDLASDMVDRYGLRAYDAMQLAGCLVVASSASQAPTFVCSDLRLLEAARSEGLSVFDPTN